MFNFTVSEYTICKKIIIILNINVKGNFKMPKLTFKYFGIERGVRLLL